MEKMKWYVLNHNFNEDTVEMFNIFNSVRFSEGLEKLLNNYVTFDNFVENLEKELMYAFWSKSEYEIMVGGLFSKENKYQKIDIYDQVKPNVRALAKYIIDVYNNEI